MGFPSLRSGNLNPIAGSQPSYPIFADPASYTLTGATASLIGANRLTASEATYTETGSAVTFTHTIPKDRISVLEKGKWRGGYPRAFHPSLRKPVRQAGVISYTFDATGTTYDWTGQDVTFSVELSQTALSRTIVKPLNRRVWPRPFAPGPWGHLTHQRSQNRIGTSATAFFGFDADGATYALSGGDADLTKATIFDSQGATYVLLVLEAFLPVTMPAAGASYTFTGADVTFLHPAQGATFTWTGASVNLTFSGGGLPLFPFILDVNTRLQVYLDTNVFGPNLPPKDLTSMVTQQIALYEGDMNQRLLALIAESTGQE